MKFYFKNFVNLSELEKEKILILRNSDYVRKNMYNSEKIELKNHMAWIENLKTRNDCKYWAVFVDNNLVGAIDLTDIDMHKKFAEWGFYIDNKFSGIGAIVEYLGTKHFFDNLKFEKILAGVFEENTQVYNMHKRKFNYIDIPELSIEKKGRKFNALTLTKTNWNKVEHELKNLLTKFYNIEEVIWE